LTDRRIGVLFAGFLALFALVAVRAAWIQGVQGAGLSADAANQHSRTAVVPGLRGEILDRTGRNELAVSEDAVNVFATPYQVSDTAKTAAKLAPLLHMSANQIVHAIGAGSSGFAYIAHRVDLPTAAKIEKLGLAGIGTEPAERRVYPQGDLAAQVIGSVGENGQGSTGLEAADDSTLAGSDGQMQVIVDGLGKEIARHIETPANQGQNLELTIDAAIQAKTEAVLKQTAATYKPARATAIVMNPDNGEVLAMADWPSTDPSNPTSLEALQNTATAFNYEPGSTFKAFTIAGALEDGKVTPTTQFYLPTELQYADRTITDAESRGVETLDVAHILAQSSNIGADLIGQKLGAARMAHWINRFGFGEPTGIDFPGEEQGIVPPLSTWSVPTMGNLPIGQGLSVTPIQMATAYSAIANGGILRPPRLILKNGDQAVPEPAGHRVISESDSNKLRKMLEGVLAPGGTASEVSVPGYTLAGKTGTAQKVVNGTYSDTQFVASFVGFAPAQDPKLLVAVVVDDPTQGSYYGGTVAAPAFGEIAKFALPYLGIQPDLKPGESPTPPYETATP
jgi:cell division protein FtsI (penicillin-binding protein 3)